MKEYVEIKNARVHNLRGIDVRIPKNKLTIITGVSGSGKSSLAFDTLYEEGRKRYLMFSGTQFIVEKETTVDEITGDSPENRQNVPLQSYRRKSMMSRRLDFMRWRKQT